MPARTEAADVVVIGGGVSGLACARDLSSAGYRVILLEARGRLGGRIDTQRPAGWPAPVELGAEFVHSGNADLWRLLKEARVRTRKLEERHWLRGADELRLIPDLDKRIASVTGRIKRRRADALSFASYFRRYPEAVPREEWNLTRSFVEGFEAAPMGRISARALAGETMDEAHQYAVPAGYDRVISKLADDCVRNGVGIRKGALVRSVRWRRSRVRVTSHNPGSGAFTECAALAAVVTLPVGVLKATGSDSVRFEPELTRKRAVIEKMQVGDVVRLAVRFHPAAWRRLIPKLLLDEGSKGFGFIHSSAKGVPVWWSLSGQPILVGWAGGPAAKALLKVPLSARVRMAERSLAEILEAPLAQVRRAVADWQAHDWTHDPFSRGAYSFTAAGGDDCARKLGLPVRGTLFFAGEATAEGSEVGTVHGALASGLRASREVMRALRPHVSRVQAFRRGQIESSATRAPAGIQASPFFLG